MKLRFALPLIAAFAAAVLCGLVWSTKAPRDALLTKAQRRSALAAAAMTARTSTATQPAATQRRTGFVLSAEWGRTGRLAIDQFAAWCARYAQADLLARRNLLVEGESLAATRRSELRRLIVADPAKALAAAVPAGIPSALPSSVTQWLEQRVDGVGDLQVLYQDLANEANSGPERYAKIGDQKYRAHVYGAYQALATRHGIGLHGIALDGELALLDSTLRALEPEEAGAAGSPLAFSNGAAILPASSPESALQSAATADRALGLAAYAGGATSTGTMSADAVPGWSIGTKKLLVIRANFPDLTTEPVTAADARKRFSQEVEPYYVKASFGRFTLTTTVTDKLYTLSTTAASFSSSGDTYALHQQAAVAAAADYAVASFDLVMVVFPHIDSNAVVGKSFEFGGLAEVGGTRTWINGGENFYFAVLAHELGHNLGLGHANSLDASQWPQDLAGASPYGDLQDVMGSGDGHFNPAFQQLLGWLPTATVISATTSADALRLYAQTGDGADGTHAVTLKISGQAGNTIWVFPRSQGSISGSQVVIANPGWLDVATLNLETPDGVSQLMATGTYYSDMGSGAVVTASAMTVAASATTEDFAVAIPTASKTGMAALSFDFVPRITEADSKIGVIARATGAGVTLSWQKRLFAQTNWQALAAGDFAGPAIADGILVARDRGIQDLRCVASSSAGQIISNPVRIAPMLALDPSTISVGASAQRYPLAVTVNGAWSILVPDPWLSVSPSSGSGCAVVMVTVAENTSTTIRNGSLSIGGQAHRVTQGIASSESAQVFAGGNVAIGPQVTWTATPTKWGDGFTSMPSPGIFVKADGSRWAVAREMMTRISSDWMLAKPGLPDWTAEMGRLINVPNDIVAFSMDVANGGQVAFIRSDGSVYTYRDSQIETTSARLIGQDAVAVTCGTTAASYLNSKGELWSWGYNYFGEVLDGTTTPRPDPVLVATSVASMSAATHQHFLVTKAGGLKGDGKDCYSNLGTPVGFETNVAKVSAGGVHTLILMKDGSVWAFGRNQEGQVGDGTWMPRDTPVKVADNIADKVGSSLQTASLNAQVNVVSMAVNAVAGDYFEVFVEQGTGGNLDVNSGSETCFSMEVVR